MGILSVLVTGSVFGRAFWEIRDSQLPYIAKIRYGRGNAPVVIYNPVLCEKIGDKACVFFREHADAHNILNHPLYDPEYYTQSQEDAADCYAARVAKPEQVRAAVQLMESDEASNYPITGDPDRRAILIRDCAVKYNNWSG